MSDCTFPLFRVKKKRDEELMQAVVKQVVAGDVNMYPAYGTKTGASSLKPQEKESPHVNPRDQLAS